MARFFVSSEELNSDFPVLTGDNAAHAKVLRLKSGEQVTVCDGQGRECVCQILEVNNGEVVTGFLEVLPDGFGFIRSANFLSGPNDVYLSQSQIRRFRLKTGDYITGYKREPKPTEKFSALMYLTAINGIDPEIAKRRKQFEDS